MKKLFVMMSKGHSSFPINLLSILFIQSNGNYLLIYLEDGRKFEPNCTLQQFIAFANTHGLCFVQIHRSYAVNFEKVVEFNFSDSSVKVMDYDVLLTMSDTGKKLVKALPQLDFNEG